MIDFTWKLFSQTGNIETYLLLKELEQREPDLSEQGHQDEQGVSSFDTNL
ncbi:YqzL family protein [Virgibacillus kekensis]|uniref:YqzL family protein n=1 Tax=Virgibacillus kekensis TaxID=202261 RepID=A0ABV9DJ61_9BACI